MEINSVVSNRKWLNVFLTCFLGGIFGLHRFYTGKKKQGALTLLICAVGIVFECIGAIISAAEGSHSAWLAMYIIGGVILFGLLVWEVVDLFLVCSHKYKDIEGATVMEDITR